MKTSKNGNSLRLIAILIVAVMIVFTVGFAAGGWQNPSLDNSGDADNNSGDTDENNNVSQDTTIQPPPEPPKVPDFLDYLTGLEISEEEYEKRKICYVLESSGQLYGISSSDLLIEIPIENGATRLVAYVDEGVISQPKIGSVAKSRDYISSVVAYFGGIIVSAGEDDIVSYAAPDTKSYHINLSENAGYYYTEYGKYVYTNANLIEALLLSHGISLKSDENYKVPFIFNDYFSENVRSGIEAKRITVSYSEDNILKFSYTDSGDYSVYRNGAAMLDTKSGEMLHYENVFTLFADAKTYEKIDGVETVVNTSGSGVGYYFTEGTCFNVRWYCDEGGALVFLNDAGEKLTVNRGASYVTYVKSSMFNDVTFGEAGSTPYPMGTNYTE